ncbi:replication-relaxation family protein [Nocardia arthritidis]|uniref:replication-relaxation family protein n=1 Tax=Nocardia arthritidis TaxID=228602 RepID=UPI000A010B4F|nr:replication-relaxation family protein [Nocardia arthritidis]
MTASCQSSGTCPAVSGCGMDPAAVCPLLRRDHLAHHVGDHFALSSSRASSPVGGESVRVRATTDAGFSSSSPRPHGPGRPIRIRRDAAAIGAALSERDWAVLRSVDEYRFLTVRQLHDLHFYELSPSSGLRITQRALARLRQWRVLGTLERRIGGLRAGSSGLVHYVDVIGDKLLRTESGRTARRRYTTPSRTFLNHTLAVAESRITLLTAQLHGTLEVLRADVETAAWRTYQGLGGALLTLRPDLYLETAGSVGGELVSTWFLERDMGSESIPTLVKKSREYENYRSTGVEQEQSGGSFPLIVWCMTAARALTAEQRRNELRDRIERDSRLPAELFRIISPDQLIELIQKGGDL